MKKRLIITEFLLAGLLMGSGKMLAQEAAPDKTGDAPSITVSSFLRQFADKPPFGPLSTNTVGLFIVDAKARGWTGEVIYGTDWPSPVPGVERSQTARLEGLSLEKKSGKRSVQIGTIGLWGPLSGDQRTGDKNNLANSSIFGIGGAYGNLLGVRAGDTIGTGKWTGTVDAFLGTGDRGLTGGEFGAPDPSFCQNNLSACGLVGGVNGDWRTTKIPGLTLTAQETRVGNGHGLYNELRSTGDVQYKLKTGPVTWTGLGEYTHGIHYQGEKANIDMKAATIKAEKPLGKGFGLRGYVSETHTNGALAKQFVLGGTALTYRNASNDLSIEFHNEPTLARHTGTTVSWHHTLGTLHFPHK